MRKQWTKEELVAFESRIADLYLDHKLPFLFHLSGGNEDQLIEIFKNINEGDYVISNHRSHYHALLHGIPPEEVENYILNGRSMFIYDKERNFFVSAIIGGTPAIAAGIALALKKKGSKQRVWCFVGDGTEDNGHLFEAVRYVDGFDLPCTFVIENNNRSVETPNDTRWGKTHDYQWNSKSVIKYYYDITYPHARLPGQIDLSKLNKKTDIEYFPLLKKETRNYDTDFPETKYSEAMKSAMAKLGEDNKVLFIGYNIGGKYGNAMGTLAGVNDNQKLETPVAENLMAGLAIGCSFEGFRPVIYFERQDFMLVAADAIINHIDKIERISHGQYKVPIIMRSIVADSGPFYSGPTHSQDFSEGFKKLVNFEVVEPKTGKEVLQVFDAALKSERPTLVIERKSYY